MEHIIPDQAERDIILEDLDSSILVEAAAGTGKTTSMVRRMTRLVATGKCAINSMAAVTFTRKAAAELRSRFQIELEQELKTHNNSANNNLHRAIENIETCFIGTIHSFCGRILRERPVEAGVDINFREIDEAEDAALMDQSWDAHIAELYARNDPILEELELLGVEIGELRQSFHRLALYPDIDEWPAEKTMAPSREQIRDSLDDFFTPLLPIVDQFPSNYGSDKLIPHLQKVSRMFRQATRTNRPHELFEILEEFKPNRKPAKKYWPGGPKQADAVLEQWEHFRVNFAEPLTKKWREHRYEPVLRAIRGAISTYDNIREQHGKLNFQDLLMKAATLLRDKPMVRTHFRRRFSHLLVDEFQDTDPIQAEVMMLLVSDDASETDWRKCRPRPGALFVVGDPKQSIYRFRRADIVTYNQVKKIISPNSGKIVTLSTNFRSTGTIIDWINKCFQNEFSRHSEECSPIYVPLLKGPSVPKHIDEEAIQHLTLPDTVSNLAQVTDFESEIVARIISRLTAPENDQINHDNSSSPELTPGDFLIMTYRTTNLSSFGDKLSEYGIPHSVTGGSALNQVRELKLLYNCIRATLEPQDPVALVAALRSEAFGISDVLLYRFKRSGGVFDYNSQIPSGLDSEVAGVFQNVFFRFRDYALRLKHAPIIAGIEYIIADLGLAALCAARPGGNATAGSLFKALDLMRQRLDETWSLNDLVKYLGRLVNMEETHDAVLAKPGEGSVVRVMNLHKAKGLEAKVVFLVDPTGKSDHPPAVRIDRSGPESLGYLLIQQASPGSFQTSVLAQPLDWEKHDAIEREFETAEYSRLLYVAATRAGSNLVISKRAGKKNDKSPWGFFDPYLKEMPPVETFQDVCFSKKEGLSLGSDAVKMAYAAIRERWLEAAKPTYVSTAIKKLALDKTKFEIEDHDGSTIFDRGEAIHIALQNLMIGHQLPVQEILKTALAHLDVSPDIMNEVNKTAERIVASEIWSRALNSHQRHAEIPFSVCSHDNVGSVDVQILRGVIDLVFREPDGWVVVDYKTDRSATHDQDRLKEVYKPQLIQYARAWTQLTGEPVKEVGLLFTETQSYVIL